ncbi:hypothetical protein DLAC_11133 [Tieghemostelium lacteum]|uniref:tRNA (guanine(46)-N(7))-methyltransferase n=1 Tax=Tieghemostelium lacteum TaxID=361077 RepID=A0A151Z3B0_TIELA|nr:hypothetical protein DLAC_11133 [Tieghemostelium lacteum]|eukprot:KYQ88429.1 hypothetical protein DLAC_11133 [Tieghemostelium lacteum]
MIHRLGISTNNLWFTNQYINLQRCYFSTHNINENKKIFNKSQNIGFRNQNQQHNLQKKQQQQQSKSILNQDIVNTYKKKEDRLNNKFRQLVNPFISIHQKVVDIPKWEEIYSDMSLPFHLDIGCGVGEMILERSIQRKDLNLLGIDIRDIFIGRAFKGLNEYRLQQQDNHNGYSKNLHFMIANINVNLLRICKSLPKNSIKEISLLFCDPHVKKKHLKRRMVNKALVDEIVLVTEPNATVYIGTDIAELYADMDTLFSESTSFKKLNQSEVDKEWILPPTKKETFYKNMNTKVYKTIFRRI